MNKVVFITGIFRSGTTLLTRATGAHPGMNSVYQLFFPFFIMWKDLFFRQKAPGYCFSNKPLGSDIFSDEKISDIFKKTAACVYFSKDDLQQLKGQLASGLERDKKEKPEIDPAVYGKIAPGNAGDILIRMLETVSGYMDPGKIFVFKEIWCEDFVPVITGLAGIEVRTIHMIRDPRAVFSSRNTGRYLKECGKKYPLLFIAEAWKRSVNIAENTVVPGSRVVRYEDVVLHPEEAMKDVSEFIGVKFCSEMIEPSRFRDGRGNIWTSNTTGSDPVFGFDKKPLTYWKTSLSDDEIGSIEFICDKEMSLMGYEMIFPIDKSRKLFSGYREEKDEIQPWLLPFDYLCDDIRVGEEMKTGVHD